MLNVNFQNSGLRQKVEQLMDILWVARRDSGLRENDHPVFLRRK